MYAALSPGVSSLTGANPSMGRGSSLLLIGRYRHLNVEYLPGAKSICFGAEEICQLAGNLIFTGLCRSHRYFDYGQIDVILVLRFGIVRWRGELGLGERDAGNRSQLQCHWKRAINSITFQRGERHLHVTALTGLYRRGGFEIRLEDLR